MKTITVRANEISQPVYAGAGSRITLTGSGYVEWAGVEKLQDALNGTTWQTWPAGSTAGYRDTDRGMAIRVVGAGACVVTVEEGKADRANENAYWQGVGDNATVITNPLTGGMVISAGSKARAVIGNYPEIDAIDGVVAFWDFAEPRAPYYSKSGRGLFPLRQGPGSRAVKSTGGPLGHSVVFNGTSDYLIIDSDEVGDLNIGGRGLNECFVLAFVKRSNATASSFIAGAWREDNADPRRQYGLFVDLPTYGGDNKVCFHVSKTGGATPGLPYSRDYSANGSGEVGRDFVCIAGGYDGAFATSYIEGRIEPYAAYTESGPPNGAGLTYDKNPYYFPDGLNDSPCEFTVGACKLTSGYSNFFAGEVAALLVLDRAPTQAEVVAIQLALSPASAGIKNRLYQWSAVSSAPSSLYGCHAYRASADDSDTVASWIRTTTGSPDQGFVYRPTSSAGAAMFTWESVPLGISTDNLASIAVQLANAALADVLRLCVKIGGAWYSTDQTYAVSAASASGGDWSLAETKTLAFSTAAAGWRDMTVLPGTSLSVAGAARSTALPSGAIEGVGVYGPSQPAGNVRVRNFELVTL